MFSRSFTIRSRVVNQSPPTLGQAKICASSMASEMKDLSQRFKSLSIATQATAAAACADQMDYQELGQCRIAFRDAHLGKTYQEVVQKETKYVAWFAQTYHASQKPSHIQFLRYIQLHCDELEQKLPHREKSAPMIHGAKNKARAAPRSPTSMSRRGLAEEEPIETDVSASESAMWNLVQENEFSQQRIHHLEHALAQVIEQVQALTQIQTERSQTDA